MTGTFNVNPPKGLLQEPLLQRLLGQFIDKIDKQQSRLSIKVCIKNTPELFAFNEQDTDYLWSLIDDELGKHFSILTIKLNKPIANDVLYSDAILYFNRDKETLIRIWMNRPALLSEKQLWLQAIDATGDIFSSAQKQILFKSIFKVKTKNAEYVASALSQMGKVLSEASTPITLRTLSSLCFDGDSKVLDHRADWVMSLYPEHKGTIKLRPLLLSVVIPDVCEQVLFVENQETFLELFESNHSSLEKTALVYSAGFRSSANRSRQVGGVLFSTLNNPSQVTKKKFKQWWLGNAHELPCYFWGDLDFSGMTILATLKQSFPQLQAWKIGYDAMLSYYYQGFGHTAEQANKQEQRDPLNTYCQYADTVLLPLLRKSNKLLDQEIVTLLLD